MKLKQLFFFFNFFILNNFYFFIIFIINIIKKFFFYIFFNWKINNYADSYWFLYSNKKSISELRNYNT